MCRYERYEHVAQHSHTYRAMHTCIKLAKCIWKKKRNTCMTFNGFMVQFLWVHALPAMCSKVFYVFCFCWAFMGKSSCMHYFYKRQCLLDRITAVGIWHMAGYFILRIYLKLNGMLGMPFLT